MKKYIIVPLCLFTSLTSFSVFASSDYLDSVFASYGYLDSEVASSDYQASAVISNSMLEDRLKTKCGCLAPTTQNDYSKQFIGGIDVNNLDRYRMSRGEVGIGSSKYKYAGLAGGMVNNN